MGRARENNQGNKFGVDKGSGETGLSSEMSVNTKEDEAFEKDVLTPSLIRLRWTKSVSQCLKTSLVCSQRRREGMVTLVSPF